MKLEVRVDEYVSKEEMYAKDERTLRKLRAERLRKRPSVVVRICVARKPNVGATYCCAHIDESELLNTTVDAGDGLQGKLRVHGEKRDDGRYDVVVGSQTVHGVLPDSVTELG